MVTAANHGVTLINVWQETWNPVVRMRSDREVQLRYFVLLQFDK